MFVVPEIDDDIETATTVENEKLISQLKNKAQTPPSQQRSSPVPLLEKSEKSHSTTEISSSVASSKSMSSKQQRSRRSLFHRNTIHVCDQIVDQA